MTRAQINFIQSYINIYTAGKSRDLNLIWKLLALSLSLSLVEAKQEPAPKFSGSKHQYVQHFIIVDSIKHTIAIIPINLAFKIAGGRYITIVLKNYSHKWQFHSIATANIHPNVIFALARERFIHRARARARRPTSP